MIRFFTLGLWSVVASEGYQYVMRLDADSYIRSPIGYNLFSFMRARQIDYAYRLAAWEDSTGTHGDRFHNFVRNYAIKHQITPEWLLEPCPASVRSLQTYSLDHCGPLYAPYNNFFITNISFWLSFPVHAFLTAIDSSHTIYTERWGDLLWHAAAIQLFMPVNKVHMFSDFAYEHVSLRGYAIRGSRRTCTLYGGIAVSSAVGDDEAAINRTIQLALIPRCIEGPRRCYLRSAKGTRSFVAGMPIGGIGFGRVSLERPVCGGDAPPYYCNTSWWRHGAPTNRSFIRFDAERLWNIATCLPRAQALAALESKTTKSLP